MTSDEHASILYRLQQLEAKQSSQQERIFGQQHEITRLQSSLDKIAGYVATLPDQTTVEHIVEHAIEPIQFSEPTPA